jgi:anion-transporting  ArsA/GET3 family ATPase
MTPQLHFVCGKGGVGKSTFSCALALHFVQQNQRTLLVQVNAKDSHSQMLESAPIGPEVIKISPLLWAANVTPDASLHEYLMLKLHSERLYKLVFDNGFMRSFLKFTPSLAELNMLGKIWFHAQQKDADGKPVYARVVVDCPATGHGYRFLRVAQVTYESVHRGAIASEALAMAKTIADPEQALVHLVSLPQEMPASEAIELATKIEASNVSRVGSLVINNVTQRLFDEDASSLVKSLDPVVNPWVVSGLHRCAQEENESEQIARLQAALPRLKNLILPHLNVQSLGPRELEVLQKAIAEAGL